jgi:gluconate 5-dehydrogenase
MRSQRHERIIYNVDRRYSGKKHGSRLCRLKKIGLAGFTGSLAAELGEHGITCNAFSPGWFETEFTAALLKDATFVARINDKLPLRRWGKPPDLPGAAIFLASDATSYITAQKIVVDGGLSAAV